MGFGSAVGILQLDAGIIWNNSGDVFVGGDFVAQVSNGRLNITAAASRARVTIGGTLRVYSTGTVNFDSGTLSAATLDVQRRACAAGGWDGSLLKVSNLAMSGAGKIDLANNAMIVDYGGASPLSAIQAFLLSGYNGGSGTATASQASPPPGKPEKRRWATPKTACCGTRHIHE